MTESSGQKWEQPKNETTMPIPVVPRVGLLEPKQAVEGQSTPGVSGVLPPLRWEGSEDTTTDFQPAVLSPQERRRSQALLVASALGGILVVGGIGYGLGIISDRTASYITHQPSADRLSGAPATPSGLADGNIAPVTAPNLPTSLSPEPTFAPKKSEDDATAASPSTFPTLTPQSPSNVAPSTVQHTKKHKPHHREKN